jgi:hypothetical protein
LWNFSDGVSDKYITASACFGEGTSDELFAMLVGDYYF